MPFILTLLATLVRQNGAGGVLIAGMSFIGGIIGTWFFLAVGSDGSLTTLSGGVANVIASASTANVWAFLTYLPLSFALMAFMAAMYRGWESF